MTVVRKRHVLTGMKYDRVDLVGEGANGHADILIAKNRQPQNVAKRAMGTYQCGDCGANQKGITKSRTCISCDSHNLQYVEVVVSKKVTPVGKQNPQQAKTKKVPKNDDASNAGQYTFEDEQYDQDNGENGQALGDAVERSVLNKGADVNWFEVDVEKATGSVAQDEGGQMTPQAAEGDGGEVDTVDNERFEHQKEGADPDDDIENKSMKTPTGTRPDKRSGYGSHVPTNIGKKKKLAKEKPGLNSWDYGDQGSQQVAESAEQMYRSNSQPTRQAQSRQESTKSKVVVKARRKKTNHEGLDIMDHGNDGIYNSPGVKRNGTNTGHNKHTTRGRTAVAPPQNPLDVGKSRVAKSVTNLSAMEALNLGVQFAENISRIVKANKPEAYNEVMADFVETVNAAAGEWFVGSNITKSKDSTKQANDIAQRALSILAKASPASEMSDEASEGEDADKMDSVADNHVGKLKTSYPGNNKNEKEQTVGKKKVFKSLNGDPYAGLPDEIVKKFQELDELKEERAQSTFIAKARELRGLPGFNEERVAKQLRDAYEVDQENGDYLFQTLSAAANVAHDSTIFKQFGMPGQGTDGADPMAKAFAYADGHVSKGAEGPTREQLVVNYMKDNPELYYQEAKTVR